MGVNEEFVIAYAQRKGTDFDVALGKLLTNGTLSARSNAVKALNFNDSSVRGVDLVKSVLNLGDFSSNSFSFKRDLMKSLKVKNDNELNKRVLDFEFKEPLMIIAALMAQFNRLESRYILNGISFKEAYARRRDFDNTLGNICFDLNKFGLSSNILYYIRQFASDVVNPKFDLYSIKDSNTTYSNINNNSNTNKNECVEIDEVDRFVLNKTELLFNVNDNLGCQINLVTPIYDLYNKNRSHISKSTITESLTSKWLRGEKPLLCPNGSCRLFNFGVEGHAHSEICKNKKEEHVLLHFCAYCGEGSPHPIILCPFIRCNMVLVKCIYNDWLTRTYSLIFKRIQSSYRNNSNNRNYRNNNSRNGRTRGGYNSHNNGYTSQYNNSNMGGYNDNQGYDIPNNGYDSYYDNGYTGQQQHFYNNNNNAQRSHKNKRRNGGNGGSGQSSTPHNSNG